MQLSPPGAGTLRCQLASGSLLSAFNNRGCRLPCLHGCAAVVLVGYDSSGDQPYWILKNSWVSDKTFIWFLLLAAYACIATTAAHATTAARIGLGLADRAPTHMHTAPEADSHWAEQALPVDTAASLHCGAGVQGPYSGERGYFRIAMEDPSPLMQNPNGVSRALHTAVAASVAAAAAAAFVESADSARPHDRVSAHACLSNHALLAAMLHVCDGELP